MNATTKNQKKSVPAKALMFVSLQGLIGAGVGYWVGSFVTKSSVFREQFQTLGAWDLLVLPILVLLVLAFHEMGHLMGGFTRGMKFLLFIVGPFQLSHSPSGVRFKWVFNLGTFGGLAAAMPNPDLALAPQLTRLIAGGPLASLLLAAFGLLLGLLADGQLGAYGFLVGGFSALIFLVTALPFRAGGFMSDGMQLLEVMRGGRAVEERQTLTMLMAQSMSGVRPRELDQQAIARALNFDGEPLREVVAHMYAYYAALDRQDEIILSDQAGWLAEHVNQLPVGFRQSLTLELAMFESCHGSLEAARDWLSKSKGGVVDGARRALAEALFAIAEDNKQAAKTQLAKARKLKPRGYDAGAMMLTADLIEAAEKLL